MPRLKIDDDELDVDELENAEWDESKGNFERYDGEIPPKDTLLVGYLKNAWWTETQNGDRMIKVLWIADGNVGEEEEYDGCPFWENLALTAASKFKWAPFFRQFGLTVKMVKTQTMIAEDDDNVGAPITRIGKHFIPGEDARCAIISGREKYRGEWKARVSEWLDEPELEEEDEEPEEEEETPPPPRRTARTASGAASKRASGKSSASKPAGRAKPVEEEEEDEDLDEEDEELEEEEDDTPPPPRRAAAKKPAAASTRSSTAPKAGAARPSRPSPPDRPKAAAKASANGSKTAAKKPATRPAARSRKAAADGYDDEPPF